jgi:hypothetical protein
LLEAVADICRGAALKQASKSSAWIALHQASLLLELIPTLMTSHLPIYHRHNSCTRGCSEQGRANSIGFGLRRLSVTVCSAVARASSFAAHETPARHHLSRASTLTALDV